MDVPQFIHSPIEEHLGYFQVLAVTYKTDKHSVQLLYICKFLTHLENTKEHDC